MSKPVKTDDSTTAELSRPNIVVILADDLGFSDIGCFGSEISTPNLDRLAAAGQRYTQMYNAAKCVPSRAALLTGVYPHQAGLGHMVADLGFAEYRGFLSPATPTIAESLRSSGYRTLMAGKWHLGGSYDILDPSSWRPGDDCHPTPTQRGFDEFYGLLAGAGNYGDPRPLMRGDAVIYVEHPDYYFTDQVSAEAVRMLERVPESTPFFLYLAYTAPHWPLQAPEEDIETYRSSYRDGWDAIRTSRHEELIANGILHDGWRISSRHHDVPDWSTVQYREWEGLRMAVYAAQIQAMDRGIGDVLKKCEEIDPNNTLVVFVSDNGGCAEFMAEDSIRPDPFRYRTPTVDGRSIKVGNRPDVEPGPVDVFQSYDLPWANVSNTPFRLFKSWVHEGGISTPMIVNWPSRVDAGQVVHTPVHFIDIAPTLLELCGASPITETESGPVVPIEGESFAELMFGREWDRERPIAWEHEASSAVRAGEWKLVRDRNAPWELYNMTQDRTETRNLAGKNRPVFRQLSTEYEEWANRVGVRDWPIPGARWNPATRGSHATIDL